MSNEDVTRIDALEFRMGKLEELISNLESYRLDALECKITRLEEQISILESFITFMATISNDIITEQGEVFRVKSLTEIFNEIKGHARITSLELSDVEKEK